MIKRLMIFFAIAVLLTGCLGMPWPQTSGNLVDNVETSLWVGYHSINVGQPLQIRFTAHNLGNQTTVFQTRTRPVVELSIVANRTGYNEVVQGPHWPEGKVLTPELTRLELKPGETKTLVEMTWTPDERYDRSIVSINGFLWYTLLDSDQWAPGGAVTVTVGWTGEGPFP